MANATLTRRPLAALALSAGLALACAPAPPDHSEAGEGDEPNPSALAQVRARGKLVMLTVPHQESSFTKTNLDTGPMRQVGTPENFLGIDVDLMAGFADSLGVDLEIRPAVGPDGFPSYAELIPALLDGAGDVIASSFTITAEREEIIDFSKPYFAVYPAVVTRSDSALSSPDDLEGTRPAVLPGTSQASYLRSAGFAEDDILFVEFQLETYMAVIDGQADFTLQDSATAESLVEEHEELRIAFPFSDKEDHYGFGVAPGSDLRQALDHYLASLAASGELAKMTRP